MFAKSVTKCYALPSALTSCVVNVMMRVYVASLLHSSHTCNHSAAPPLSSSFCLCCFPRACLDQNGSTVCGCLGLSVSHAASIACGSEGHVQQ